MRAFVALEIPDGVRARCGAQLDAFRRVARIRITPARNLHVTLAFLGDIGEEQVEPITAALRGAAVTVQPWTLHVHGVGAFPGWARPRVLWLGVDDPMVHCAQLHDAVWDALEPLGFQREKRVFRPHITFARVRSGRLSPGLRDALRAAESFDAGTGPAARIVMKQSTPTAQGADHEEIAAFPLG